MFRIKGLSPSEEGELSPDLTLQNQMLYSLFNGYRNTWSGSLNAPDATVSMTDTQWSMNGNSTVGNMKLNRTIVGFNGEHHRSRH